MIILLVLLMEAGMLGMVPLAGPGAADTWKGWLFAIPPVSALVIGVGIAWTRHRRRLAGIRKRLTELGVGPVMKPTADQQTELWTLIQHLEKSLQLQGGAKNIQWLASLSERDRDRDVKVWIFEYEYVTGTGKGSQSHYRTVAAWPAHAPNLPGIKLGHGEGFLMFRHGWLERRAARKEAFPARALGGLAEIWSMFGEVKTGERFITDPVRAELAHSPKGESWSIGGGWVCCVFRNRLDGVNLGRFYQRARRMLEEKR